MTPNLAGFFVEHGYTVAAKGQSVRELVSDVAQDDEEKIVTYLYNAVALFVIPGIAPDAVCPDKVAAGAEHILTDGEWAWPMYYGYYVSQYHVRVPEAFLRHMRTNNWTPPPLASEALIQLCLAIQPEDRWP